MALHNPDEVFDCYQNKVVGYKPGSKSDMWSKEFKEEAKKRWEIKQKAKKAYSIAY